MSSNSSGSGPQSDQSEQSSPSDRAGQSDQSGQSSQAEQSEQSDRSQDDQKSSEEILAGQIAGGVDELERSTSGLFLSGLSAGLDIGFGPLFMAVLLTLVAGAWGTPTTQLLAANAYAIGFVFVIGSRSALFTEYTTLAVMPVLDRKASIWQLGRLWGLVYAGNILGGIAFTVAMVNIVPAYGAAEAGAFAEIGRSLVHHDPVVLLGGGVIAGWMMGLLSWLLKSAQESISRILLVWLVATGIGIGHFPHSIAGNVEVLSGTLVSPAITWVQYVGFLALATTGNIVGRAIFVAILKYAYVVGNEQ